MSTMTQFGNLQSQLDSSFQSPASGIANTARLINRKFDDLYHELARTSRGIIRGIGFTAESIAALSESRLDAVPEAGRGFEQIASQSTLQTALLEKANNSSRELIDIAKKMQNN